MHEEDLAITGLDNDATEAIESGAEKDHSERPEASTAEKVAEQEVDTGPDKTADHSNLRAPEVSKTPGYPESISDAKATPAEIMKRLAARNQLSESARQIARMLDLTEKHKRLFAPLPDIQPRSLRLMGMNDVIADSARRRLEKDLNKQEAEILGLKAELRDSDEARKRLETYEGRLHLKFLLDSVTIEAHEALVSSDQLQNEFRSQKEISAVVVSLDIRRSTELMLKAREPRAFADFLTTLCGSIIEIFKDNYAVIDKFTGDGILAYFPFFFSGEDAVLFALKAVSEANQAFADLYAAHRHAFSPVLLDVGLGTGIDFGNLMQVNMAESLTIVGKPVVYACRFACAPAGKIYANQPIADLIKQYYSDIVATQEIEITLKHDGRVACHEVTLLKPLEREFLARPEWLSANPGEPEELGK